MKKKSRSCNACGKKQDEVKKLLLLPNYAMCDECIGLASELIEEDDDEHFNTKLAYSFRHNAKEIRKIVKTK